MSCCCCETSIDFKCDLVASEVGGKFAPVSGIFSKYRASTHVHM